MEYSDELYEMCIQMFEESRKSYEILLHNIPILPPCKEIESYLRLSTQQFSQSVSNLEFQIHSIIAEFKEKFKINNTTKVYASLAVDALFFKPDLIIKKDGITTGMLESCQIDQKTFNLFSRDLNSFINFIKENWNGIIKAGFVFQLNPLDSAYRPFVIHIIPSVNGKANQKIIDKLYEIRKILHNFRIEILSFTFDGDNAFKGLNEYFFQTYIDQMMKTNMFPTNRMICVRITPDFLHLIKRFRYRLMSNKIHMNFLNDLHFIDINEIQKVLNNVPEIVFSNLSLTKMHDSLLIDLFSLHNFLILFDKKMFDVAGYFFPFTLSIIAYIFKNIGYQVRHFLFGISLWFLIYYKQKLDISENLKLRERNSQDETDAIGYSNELIIEFANNLFSNINLMGKIDNMNLDMNSTTPLEHAFGRARIKVHDIHTIQKFIRAVGFMNEKGHRRDYEELGKIKGRTSSFGVTV